MRQNPDYATGLQDISAALIACGYYLPGVTDHLLEVAARDGHPQ